MHIFWTTYLCSSWTSCNTQSLANGVVHCCKLVRNLGFKTPLDQDLSISSSRVKVIEVFPLSFLGFIAQKCRSARTIVTEEASWCSFQGPPKT
ncbi:hypothetical protein DL96DRAFT_1608156 [Flagelloscypha sp. PMI_526]|nr:hypothetical protein DL96DRAFT_1608156 [Flagelloscypha sp. PMI_526]